MTSREKFEIDVKGKKFECERVISGNNNLAQEVVVLGVGSKKDYATYGRKGHPLDSMLGTARLIAHEIIGENANR